MMSVVTARSSIARRAAVRRSRYQQRDLADAAPRQQRHFVDDLVERAADLGSPHRRDDAKGAGVVAAGLNVDPRGIGQLSDRTGTQQGLGARCGLGRLEDLHQRSLVAGAAQQHRRPAEVVRAEHDVDPAHSLLDALPILLREATADGDLKSWLRVDQLLQAPERPVEPLVGVLPDAARIEHHDVGVLHGGCGLHAIGHE